jgi:hypothetical protein
VTVFTYDPSATKPTSLTTQCEENNEYLRHIIEESIGLDVLTLERGGLPIFPESEGIQAQGISSSGTAGLRVDTGSYKVVFFSFGFETINDATDRAVTMERVINWLKPTGPVVDISMFLQGGSRPVAGWAIPVTVKFFSPGANVMIDTPLAEFNLTTTKSGSTAVCQCSITPGIYDITVVSEHTLLNVKRNVTITAPSTSVYMGTLLEGNANNDGKINAQDVSLLSSSYLKLLGDAGFNPMADFNRDGKVSAQDVSLLSSNYLKYSPIEVP